MLRLILLLGILMELASAAEVDALLQAKCGACHNAKVKTSGFSVESLATVVAGGTKHGKAVVGGHPELSPLIRMVRGEMAPKMPVGGALDAREIALLEDWVRSLPAEKQTMQAAWRWPYEKPLKSGLPVVGNASWVRNEVDRFVLAKLEAKGIRPAAEASAATLARRLYLDLVGMPPSVDELARFGKESYDQTVDRLLADPRYGERWGRHWLDVARYGETSGLEGDGAIGNAWRYRDWVIEAFNSNMPYDRFVRLQLAGGDEHSKTRNNYQPDVQGFVPTGFLRVAPWDRSNLVAADVRQN